MSFVPPRPEPAVIAGPSGALEALIEVPRDYAMARCAVLCHPHPLMGGTMQNKVVHSAARALHERGYATLRFNFRGVGSSAGTFDEGRGETGDCLAACDTARGLWPGASLSLVGFSFGSFVACRAAQHETVRELILIAPPVARFEFAGLALQPHPTVVIQGDADDVVLAEDVVRWAQSLKPPAPIAMIGGAGHFFRGKLAELKSAVQAALV